MGETAAGYVLGEEIASGGLATVHLGRRADDPSGPPLAIKRLRPRYAGDAELASMLLEEARIVRLLRHPNVVALLDVVSTAPSDSGSGELWLVLEYVRGASLADLAHAHKSRGEQVPPEILSAIAIGLLEGLHAAHEATDESGRPLGIVHRDVSPENVLVGVDGVARVVDFGIAKAVDRALPTTRLGGLKGKMAYMAPEQIRGAPLDRRSDLWAVSVVLWEALARRRLFTEDSRQGLARMILEEAPVAPSLVAPCTGAFDALLLRGLARAPADRWSTARDMALAIAAAVPPASPEIVGAWIEARSTGAHEAPRAARPIAAEEPTGAAHGRPADARAPSLPAPLAPLPTPAAPAEPGRWSARARALAALGAALGAVVFAALASVAVAGAARGRAAPSQTSAEPRASVDAGPEPDLPADIAARGLSGERPPITSSARRSPEPAGSTRPRTACQPPYRIGPPPDFIRTPKPECFAR